MTNLSKLDINEEIISKLKKNPTFYYYRDNKKGYFIAKYVVLLKIDDTSYLCPVLPDIISYIIPFYISKDSSEVTLQETSIGDNLDARNCTLEEAIKIYNTTNSRFNKRILSLITL